ncbi:MAG: hypothetical protein OXI33_05860 [Chloroflexota bacterium]|nr:hypothetical protein [Chloroflexota bacterium]
MKGNKMKISIVILKIVSTIACIVLVLPVLWALMAIDAVEPSRSMTALLVLAGALCVLVVVGLVWAKASRKLCVGFIAAGIIISWLAYGIHPKTDSCAGCLFGDTGAVEAFIYLIGAVVGTGIMALAGLALMLERRSLRGTNQPDQT